MRTGYSAIADEWVPIRPGTDGALLLALVFPLPAALLASSNSAAATLAAFFVQYAGLLAERWYFFAEARHPQNLYYQAIS